MKQTKAKQIRQVVILINQHKAEAYSLSASMQQILHKKGIESQVIAIANKEEPLVFPHPVDAAICLGGDGTVLSAVRLIYPAIIPTLAVNIGSFGFITEVCKNEWLEAFELFEQGKASISERSLVQVEVKRASKQVFLAQGLNEVTISASGISNMIWLDLYIDQTDAGKIRSDGIIVATPTGSTAYSLAAGGPILDVNLDALIINPVCPFTLSNRPLVVGGESKIVISVRPDQRTRISLTVDGQIFFPLNEGDEIAISQAPVKAHLITSPQRNYYEVLRDKLKWSGGMHA
ncbi:MAG: NAD(+)/NADH kinase [Sphaerochaetaceae bacterium]